ncbi:MAG: LVIVD repeat-containing protein, partial [Longimicrobiales bacterium]
VTAGQTITVRVEPAHAAVEAGKGASFTAVALDAQGRPARNVQIHWLATPFDIAGVDASGKVTTFRPGQVYVLAIPMAGETPAGAPGVGVLDITERGPARLEIRAPEGRQTVVGGGLRLEVGAFTEIGDPVRMPPARWRSLHPTVADVSNGNVTGLTPGTAFIAADLGPISTTVQIEVRPNPVTGIQVTPVTQPVRVGDVIVLQAQPRAARDTTSAARAGAAPVPNMPIRWSLAGGDASVDSDGRFVANRPGTYTVVASVGARSASTSVQVVPRVESRKVELVTHAPFPAGVQAGEVWPVGDVVYVSSIAGTVYVFDIANPARPVVTDSLVVDARLVNDVSTTADGRLGVLSREGASTRRNGLIFFDASDPRHPQVLSEFSEGLSGGVHSAFIYQNYVFATDDATGSLRIIDFSNPRSPRQVARWEVERATSQPFAVEFLNVIPERYLHDVYVEDGLAYLAYWRDGLVVLDVGNGVRGGSIASPKLVSQFKYNHAELYPPGYIAGSHAVFPYGRYIFVADESYSGTVDLAARDQFATRGLVHVIDRSDLTNLRKVAEYDPVEFGAHNLWVADDLLYIGAYDGGLRVLDVSGELRGDLRQQGRVIGSLYTGSLSGYRPNMALTWSAIPHRNHIFASDINTGLWVARVTGRPGT